MQKKKLPQIHEKTAYEKAILTAFLNNLSERTEEEIGILTDNIAGTDDPEKILVIQKEVKRKKRIWSVIRGFEANIGAVDMLDLLNGVTDPEVYAELEPTVKIIIDLQDAIDETALAGTAEAANE